MYREKIDAYLDGKKEEMLRDLMTLVRIDSQRGEALPGKPYGEGPAKVIAAAGELMRSYGLKVTNYDNYVIAGDFSDQEKALDILAHLDVVPVTDEWTVTKPFEPKIVGERIYGRGTADDKGPAIAALYALRAIKELQIPLKYSVRLLLGSDEECGSSDLEYYYAREKEARFSFTPDADFPLINLEKARLASDFRAELPSGSEGKQVVSLRAGDKVNVVPAKAYLTLQGIDKAQAEAAAERIFEGTQVNTEYQEENGLLTVLIKGCAAHASTPELGVNAISAALKLIDALPLDPGETTQLLRGLGRLFPLGDTCGKAFGVDLEDEISGALTMNLGVLRLEDGSLFGEFDVRAPLAATDENVTEVIRASLASLGITMEAEKMNPAHYVPADSALVQTLLGSYERYFGKKGEPFAIGGGTYVHDLERGVAFGCMIEGVDNHMHGDDEFMEIDILMKSAKIFADAVIRLCNLD